MFQAMILDDELPCRKHIAALIEKNFENVRIIGEADSVQQGLEIMDQRQVDLIFLDIDLGRKSETGFDFLKKSSSLSYDLIVTSESDEHALEAFDYAASDYLLKPICINRLRRAINKLTHRKSKGQQGGDYKESLTESDIMNKKIGLYDKYELNFTKISDIYYCQAEGFYTRFFLKNGKQILVSKNIKEYEHLLPARYFFRAHKSFLINLNEINKYVKSDGGYVVMENGDEIPLAVRKKDDFIKSIMSFQFNGTFVSNMV